MDLDLVIVVPTYWTHTGAATDLVGATYDHPTPLDGDSTLSRLLESLTRLQRTRFVVLVLTAVTHPALEQAAAARVQNLIAPFRSHYPIAQATEADAVFIRQRHPGLADHVQMRGYGNVRNLQLLLAHALGAEVVVALDDDEIVAPDYLTTALEFVGQEKQGTPVWGVAGFYLDGKGCKLLPESLPTGNIFLDKSTIMNAGIRDLEARLSRLVETPVAFGGNMIFHRDLFVRVGFDPGITRGEDVDYVINARLKGFNFWLDKQLVITHLPPDVPDSVHSTYAWSKLHQDVLRFVYEREKLRLAGVDPSKFDPYPGRFLRDDLEQQALEALKAQATPETTARFGSPEEIVTQARRYAGQYAPRYFDFAQAWPRLMDTVGADDDLRRALAARLGM